MKRSLFALFCYLMFYVAASGQSPLDSIYDSPEFFPTLKDCGEEFDSELYFDRLRCTKQELDRIVSQNLKYPRGAFNREIQGQVVIGFTVDKNGIVEDPKVIKDIGYKCGLAAMDVVPHLPEFIPGRMDGIAVKTFYRLPIDFYDESFKAEKNFNLTKISEFVAKELVENGKPIGIKKTSYQRGEKKESNEFAQERGRAVNKDSLIQNGGIKYRDFDVITEDQNELRTVPVVPPSIPKSQLETIFKVVENMPHFPACEDVDSYYDRRDCAKEEMMKFIYDNLRYPEQAEQNRIEASVVVSFIVEKDGSITGARILRDFGGGWGFGTEAKRLVDAMPQPWVAGKQRGKTVRVQFNLPIKFSLDGE